MIEELKKHFAALVAIDTQIAKLIPDNNPHKAGVGNKFLDLMLRIQFLINTEIAETSNPIGVKVSEKPKLAGVDHGAN